MSLIESQLIAETRRYNGNRRKVLEVGRTRLIVTSAVFFIGFLAISFRLVDLTMFSESPHVRFVKKITNESVTVVRANILDRNGIVLATSLPTASLYADPSMIFDAKEVARRLLKIFPDLNAKILRNKMITNNRFVWLKRNLSPDQQYQVNRLGIPGLGFQREEKRIQPHGKLVSHVIGLTDIDGRGISGIERYFDNDLKLGQAPILLSIDLRVQAIMHRELTRGIDEFAAIGAAGVVMDVRTGEIIAMVSLPDFDPNNNRMIDSNSTFNRVVTGVYEMGSTFKLFTAAIALDSGVATMSTGYDASDPISVSRFKIRDFHAQKRWLSLPEVILHSSNIGAAKMALHAGSKVQKNYLDRFGLLDKMVIELPEISRPIKPSPWRDINTMTIAFGHGLAVTPLQLAAGVAGITNDGKKMPATLLRKSRNSESAGQQVVTPSTSHKIRQLMRLVVAKGTGRRAEVPGYFVGGKTGTAQKQLEGQYLKKANLSSFLGVFPIHSPQYLILAVLDEPKGNKNTFGYSTGGWVAAPIVKKIISSAGPILGLAPTSMESDAIALPVLSGIPANVPNHPQMIDKVQTKRLLDDMEYGRGGTRKLESKKRRVASKLIDSSVIEEAPNILSRDQSEPSSIEKIARKSLQVMEKTFVAH